MSAGTLNAAKSSVADLPETAPGPGQTVEQIQSAVRRAWRSVVGRRGLSGELTLENAGCDSLRILQFHLVLERELDRPVPLDLIDIEMRLDEIVATLSRPPVRVAPDSRPTVFIMPGLDDDEQRLARFRVALQREARFVLATYPDWPEMMRPGWGFADLVENVVNQALACFQGGPILLTGYSFGGEVGFQVACRLAALGHGVRWFGILDTDITRVPPPPSGGPIARIQRYLRDIAQDMQREGPSKTAGLLLAKLSRKTVGLPRVHSVRHLLRKLPPRSEFWFHRRTRSILRMQALWALMESGDHRRLDAPVTLFASEAGVGLSPPDLGWAPLCSNLTIVPVSGDHHTLFDSPHREVLYARYAEALQMVVREG